MNYKEFKDEHQLYAILIKKDFTKPGLTFFTPDSYALQMGFWDYNKGKLLKPHIHVENKRNIEKTQELIYILSGKVKVSLFKENGESIESFIAEQGDTVFHAEGGHGYEILENGTRVIEIKNGPFTGVESDKKHIEKR